MANKNLESKDEGVVGRNEDAGCVMLEIENQEIQCNKNILSEYSDFFKAMFGGNFIESNKNVIKLPDVSLKQFKIILSIINSPCVDVKDINDEELIQVLKMCILLQFNSFTEMIISRFRKSPPIENCIILWQTMEQLRLKEFALECKTFCLLNFEKVKSTRQILSLDLKELYNYLADTKLCSRHEYQVFEVCLAWWKCYTNKEAVSLAFRNRAFLCFLHCLDYGDLSIADIRRMISFMNGPTDGEIRDTLVCIIEMKERNYLNKADLKLHDFATKLYNSQSKNSSLICVLLNSGSGKSVHHNYSNSTFELSDEDYEANKNYDIAYYDEAKQDFVIFANVCSSFWYGLCGFKIVNHMDTIFVFGGQYGIGEGSWNYDVWAFNCTTRSWTNKAQMPHPRRHFFAAVGDRYIYVVGGYGKYRKPKNTLLCYNVAEDSWSSEIESPWAETRNGGYCNNHLVLVNVHSLRVYIFFHGSNSWKMLDVDVTIPTAQNSPNTFLVFTYNNFIYIKGEFFVTLYLLNCDIKILGIKRIDHRLDEIVASACISRSKIFTIYKSLLKSGDVRFILEKYCTKSHHSEIVFEISDVENESNLFYVYFSNAFVLHDIFSKDKEVVNEFTF